MLAGRAVLTVLVVIMAMAVTMMVKTACHRKTQAHQQGSNLFHVIPFYRYVPSDYREEPCFVKIQNAPDLLIHLFFQRLCLFKMAGYHLVSFPQCGLELGIFSTWDQ